MADLAVRADCVNHPDRLAVAACDRCRKAVCPDCREDGVAVDAEFCSTACRSEAEASTVQRLLAGLDQPFLTGWDLWRRALPALTRSLLPVAAFIVGILLLDTVFGTPTEPVGETTGTVSLPTTIASLTGFVFGLAVVATVLSKEHTGVIRGNVYTWVLRRIASWVLSWLLVLMAVFLGTIALIVPGIIAGLRLFWADEFALAHRCDPVTSLKESWALTRDQATAVFSFQLLAGVAAWGTILAGVALATALQWLFLQLGDVGVALSLLALLLLAFLGYGLIHAPEVAKFYGMRAAMLAGVEPGAPIRLGLAGRRPMGS